MLARIENRDGVDWLTVSMPIKTPTGLSDKGNASVCGGPPISVMHTVPTISDKPVPITIRLTGLVDGGFIPADAPIVKLDAAKRGAARK